MGDDEFEERPEVSEVSESKSKTAPQSRLGVGLLLLAGIVGFGVLTYYGILQGIVGWLALPAIVLTLLWFVYWVFLRRLIRIRKIQGIRERRWLREAAQRKRDG